MDKRNQMENPFFDPDKPGSIFVGMDRYHQYSPHQPRNALTFIQKGDADSLFRKFLIDNIKEAECCPYIPDTELLRFDLANMRQVPPVDTHTPFEEYISKELLPYLEGSEPLETAVERLKQETRRYAKRQITWFKRRQGTVVLEPDTMDTERLIAAATAQAEDFLYGKDKGKRA